MSSYNFSRKVARESGSNFYWSFFFLPRVKRNGILSVYAFSRMVDDAVDEAVDPTEAGEQIALWRSRLKACYNGYLYGHVEPRIDHPLLPELADTIRRFHLPEKYFLDLLTGIEMDLEKKRYGTFSELETYCYHVAGTIGLLCNRLFGVPKKVEGEQYANLLGTAFQLTNIIRDVGTDAKRGRIYIPLDEMRRFGVTEAGILQGSKSEDFHRLMDFQAKRAEEYFQEAFAVLSDDLRRRIVPAEIMTAVYYRILQKLRKENFPVYEKKVSLSVPEKLRVVLRAALRSRL